MCFSSGLGCHDFVRLLVDEKDPVQSRVYGASYDGKSSFSRMIRVGETVRLPLWSKWRVELGAKQVNYAAV